MLTLSKNSVVRRLVSVKRNASVERRKKDCGNEDGIVRCKKASRD